MFLLPRVCLVIFLVHIICKLGLVEGEEFYVTAFPNGEPCPSDYNITCHNLSFYLSHKDDFFKSNVIFSFLQGTHQLSTHIMIENLQNLTLRGLGDIVQGFDEIVTQSTSVIHCNETADAGIKFVYCENISVISITMMECGKNFAPAALSIESSSGANLFINLSIQNSTNWGLNAYQVGNITIAKSVFVRAGIQYQLYSQLSSEWFIEIVDTNVTLCNHNGLVVRTGSEVNSGIVKIKSSNFMKNKINLEFLFSSHYSLDIDNLACNHALQKGFYLTDTTEFLLPSSINIANSSFAHNNGDALNILWYGSNDGTIFVTLSRFFNNSGGNALYVGKRIACASHLKVQLTNCQFSWHNNPGLHYSSAYFFQIDNVKITNNTFIDNAVTAVQIFNSDVVFEGVNVFENNTAINGGALNIIRVGTNYVLVDQNTTSLVFSNNHADNYGGAIYIQTQTTPIESLDICFFGLQTDKPFQKGQIFVFRNNTADKAGTDIYGSNLDTCHNAIGNKRPIGGTFLYISSFDNDKGDSYISSLPIKACFCDSGGKNCEMRITNYTVYPGESISYSIVLVGDRNGSTPGIMYLSVDGANTSDRTRNQILLTTAECTELNYTVTADTSELRNETILINVADTDSVFPLTINLEILQCDNGFYLSSEKHCECISDISAVASCSTSSQTIERSNRVYIGYNHILNCAIVNSNCPFDYCLTTNINITLNNSSGQCNLNRVGQLCGSCPHNYSLVFGSNDCQDCSGIKNYYYVFLIVVFAVAGVGLVLLLFICNLTVSVGTINGLILFANLLKIYQPFFSHKPIPLLSMVISWVNLDFGIQTCFFDGMNSLHKVGLQLIFPIYLWLIIVMIIVLSRYFPRLAHVIGKNGIPVLATLILLSYTKLIQTVILVFSRIHVKCGDDTTVYWHVDPTRKYLTGGHITLFVIAVITMVFIILYTLFLLFYPLLEMTNAKWRQRFSWVLFKLKPFFDAYSGPHTNAFCIWPGVLLLVRIVLALLVSLSEDQTISVGVLIPLLIILITVIMSKNVYENKYLNILEAGYITDLALVSYTRLLVSDNYASFGYAFVVMVSISVVALAGILSYHCYKYSFIGKICRDKVKRRKENKNENHEISVLINPKTSQYKWYKPTKYRESVLNSFK